MSNFWYYLLWLTAGLIIIAIISAAVTRHSRRRWLRQLKAGEALQALQRYLDWVALQRLYAFLQSDSREIDPPMDEVRTLAQQWFPELQAELQAMLSAHKLLVDFLSAQQALRLKDPETWLECDREARFMVLWQQHLVAAHAIAAKLKQAASESAGQPEASFPA